jgi:hypothetical protein
MGDGPQNSELPIFEFESVFFNLAYVDLLLYWCRGDVGGQAPSVLILLMGDRYGSWVVDVNVVRPLGWASLLCI